MRALPRQLVSNDTKQLFACVREIIDFIRQIPRFEIKTIETATSTEVVLKTDLRVIGVLLIQAIRINSPDTTVTFSALPDWRAVAGGIKIRIDTGGVLHQFTFILIGA